jgi:hypothetical protein
LKSKTLPEFWECFNALPGEIQALARKKFHIWQEHPFHSSLRFKEIQPGVWSVRVSAKYGALGFEHAEQIVWYWIGTHDDYDELV